jgi:hypothetical protein
MSNKSRHALHMITLPSVVASVAKMLGYTDHGYDLAEISVQADEFIATDDLQFKLIGNPEAKPDAADHYTKSVLWQRRAELWSILGEDNPAAFEVIGKIDTKDRPSKFATTSEKLSQCLRVLGKTWKSPAWCRIATVLDPRVDAKSKKGGRITIPVMLEMFHNEAEARAAVEEQKGGATEPTHSGNGTGEPAYPKDYADIPTEWVSALGTAVAEGGAPAKIAKDLGVSVKDVMVWRKHLNL